MDIYLIFAYITGALLITYSLLLYIFPSRKLNLFLKAGSDALCVINSLFIFLATDNILVIVGLVTNAICMVREILFSFRDKYKALNNIAWPIGFSIIMTLPLIFIYKSPLSLLPPIGSVVSTMCFYVKSSKVVKIGAITSSILYVIYYAILIPSSDVLTIFSLLSSTAGIVSSIIGLLVLFYREKALKNTQKQQI